MTKQHKKAKIKSNYENQTLKIGRSSKVFNHAETMHMQSKF